VKFRRVHFKGLLGGDRQAVETFEIADHETPMRIKSGGHLSPTNAGNTR
jgi:hypothetical protein